MVFGDSMTLNDGGNLISVAYNEAEWEYRKEESNNQSSFKHILKSPAHYQAQLKKKRITTPAMALGTAVHTLLLDGRKAFDSSYFDKGKEAKDLTAPEIKEELEKKGIEFKKSAKKADLEALLYPDGKPVDRRTGLSEDDYADVEGMASSLQRVAYFDPSQPDYIKDNEVSIYFEWEGVRFKARLDRIDFERKVVIDVKTSDSVEEFKFAWKSVDLGYIFQAGLYRKAAEIAFGGDWGFEFAVVEKQAPYIADIFVADEEFLQEGRNQCLKAIGLYKACTETQRWPTPDVTIKKLGLPSGYRPVILEEPTEDAF